MEHVDLYKSIKLLKGLVTTLILRVGNESNYFSFESILYTLVTSQPYDLVVAKKKSIINIFMATCFTNMHSRSKHVREHSVLLTMVGDLGGKGGGRY